jgi:hypothetical protein
MQRRPSLTLRDWLLLPLGLLLNMTPLWALTLLLITISICGTLYYSLNTDFFGLAAPPFAELTFSKDFSHVTAPNHRSWNILFEKAADSTFSGVVRHVTTWRDDADVPFATHDILVTTGDYSSAQRVSTRVFNHAVYYRWFFEPAPAGSIHLLHIVPLNEDIYRQLLQIREWNLVNIRGREIFRIDIFDENGKLTSYFQDQGCNSILVSAVEIKAAGTPVP